MQVIIAKIRQHLYSGYDMEMPGGVSFYITGICYFVMICDVIGIMGESMIKAIFVDFYGTVV